MVTELTTDLERRVLASAQPVIARAATEEVATRALTSAIELRLTARIDERIGAFWQGCAFGACAVALLAGAGAAASGGLPLFVGLRGWHRR